MDPDPKIITSPLSGKVTSHGITVDVIIVRLETASEWSLEVVAPEGTSTVWDDLFPSDQDALAEFTRTLEDEGIMAMLRNDKEVLH